MLKDLSPESWDQDNLSKIKLKKLLNLTRVKMSKLATLIMRPRYIFL